MQVFKAVFKIVNKRKMAALIYAMIFFVLTMMLTASSSGSKKNEFSSFELQLGIENKDQGVMGEALIAYLSQHNEIKEVPKEKEDLLDAMYYRELEYVLELPEDFSEKLLSGNRENLLEGIEVPGRKVSSLLESEVNQFLMTAGMYLDSGCDIEQAAKLTAQDMEQKGQVQFLEESNGQKLSGAYYYFNFLAYILICVIILAIGPILMVFKNKEVSARNKCSSMSFLARNVELILGCLGVVLAIYLLFMVIAGILYPEYLLGIKGVLSGINALCYILMTLGLAFLVGQFAKSDTEMHMISNVLGLGFSFLGGVFVSLDVISESVQQISKFIPSYWYVTANDAIQKIGSAGEASRVYQNFLVMLGFAAALFAAGLAVSRMKAKTA